MSNIVRNGDFENRLEEWEIRPAEYREVETIVRTQAAAEHPRGESLYFELARGVVVRQFYPWGPCATEGELSLAVYGYGADFYVNVGYEDTTVVDQAHFYGHYLDGWVRYTVPVVSERPIDRIEIQILLAMDFYIDDITLEGINTRMPAHPPEREPMPGRFDDARQMKILERRLIGIEQQMNRLTALLAKQLTPSLEKGAKTGRADESQKLRGAAKEAEKI